jgi:hypothetical protein
MFYIGMGSVLYVMNQFYASRIVTITLDELKLT